MIRIKDCTKIVNGVGVNPELQGSSIGNIPFFRNSDFSKPGNNDFLLKSESNFSFEEVKLNRFRTIPKNSLVFSKIGESIKKNHKKFTQQTSIIDNNLSAFLIKKKINEKFFYWFLNTIDFGNCLLPTTIPVLDMDVIKNIIIPDLSKKQQITIANYLDTETSKIDRKISILEQKYKKLEEYKQSVIFETVTKGLDSNVEMKDSGIDWIGEIPKHWEVKRIKEFYKLGMGQTILKEDLIEDGKYPVYSATAEDKFFGYVNKINNPLNVGDLVIPARGNSIGHVKLVKETVVCTQTTIYMKQKTKIDSNFVYYYLLGNKPQLFFFDDTAIPQITVEQINGRLILVPSANEQKEIVSYLNNLCSKLNKKLEIIKKQIELLKEYKQTIIYEAVTGKMEIL